MPAKCSALPVLAKHDTGAHGVVWNPEHRGSGATLITPSVNSCSQRLRLPRSLESSTDAKILCSYNSPRCAGDAYPSDIAIGAVADSGESWRAAAEPLDEHPALLGGRPAGRRHRAALARGEPDLQRPAPDLGQRIEVDAGGGLLAHVRRRVGAVA